MDLYARLADLPVEIESYALEPLWSETTAGMERVTTVIRLCGGGQEGLGEDVTYAPEDHAALHAAGPTLPLPGRHTIDSFSRLLGELTLFPAPPVYADLADYRRWAYESAALDLALRQAELSLADALERTPQPVRFVVSMGLGHPPELGRVERWLARDPRLRFKLDANVEWDDALVGGLAATGAVTTVDLKGAYRNTPVDTPPDPELYARVAEGLPEAWIEDPNLTPATRRVLGPHMDRVTWDAPLHSVADLRGLAHAPRAINVKPSRFGTIARLLEVYEHLAEHGIGGYGGGQTELGPGRGQIQYLAALFHADAPNDVAPHGYNLPVPPRELPPSPLVMNHAIGFRWGD